MTNWKNIHSDFTSELQKEWEAKGFNYEQTKEWVDIGLQVGEADFADFLTEQGYKAEEVLNANENNIEELREEFGNDEQKKFCCKSARQANNLVTLAISRLTRKSDNDTGRSGGLLFFGKSRLYDAIDDYKIWIVEAMELLQKSEEEVKKCNCAEKRKDENINLQDDLKNSQKETNEKENELAKEKIVSKEREIELENLTKSLAEKDGQLINTQTQLKESQEKLNNLKKEEENKNKEITSLTSSLGESKIEATELKKSAKQDELDKLNDELNINKDFKKRLKNGYEQLVKAKKNCEEDIIDEAEDNIEEIKEELKEEGISRDNIKRVSKLYEEVAQFQLDLKQARSQLKQYEAKIEALPNHNTNR